MIGSLLVAALLLTNSYLNFEKLQNSVETEYHLAEVQRRNNDLVNLMGYFKGNEVSTRESRNCIHKVERRRAVAQIISLKLEHQSRR